MKDTLKTPKTNQSRNLIQPKFNQQRDLKK